MLVAIGIYTSAVKYMLTVINIATYIYITSYFKPSIYRYPGDTVAKFLISQCWSWILDAMHAETLMLRTACMQLSCLSACSYTYRIWWRALCRFANAVLLKLRQFDDRKYASLTSCKNCGIQPAISAQSKNTLMVCVWSLLDSSHHSAIFVSISSSKAKRLVIIHIATLESP